MASLARRERGNRVGLRFRFISSKLPYLHFDTFCTYFLLFVLILEISLDLCHSFFYDCVS